MLATNLLHRRRAERSPTYLIRSTSQYIYRVLKFESVRTASFSHLERDYYDVFDNDDDDALDKQSSRSKLTVFFISHRTSKLHETNTQNAIDISSIRFIHFIYKGYSIG